MKDFLFGLRDIVGAVFVLGVVWWGASLDMDTSQPPSKADAIKRHETPAEKADGRGLIQIQFVQKSIVVVVIGGACLLIGTYIWMFGFVLSAKQETWGQFGDFLGGVLNPLIGCFTLALLVFALHLQNELLKGTREQLAISRLELSLSRNELKKSAVALAEQSQLSRQQIADSWLLSLINLRKEKLKDVGGRWKDFVDGARTLISEACGDRTRNAQETRQALGEAAGFLAGSLGAQYEMAALDALRLDLEIFRYIETCKSSMPVGHQLGLLLSQFETSEPYAAILVSAMHGTIDDDGKTLSNLLKVHSEFSSAAAELVRRTPILHQNLSSYLAPP